MTPNLDYLAFVALALLAAGGLHAWLRHRGSPQGLPVAARVALCVLLALGAALVERAERVTAEKLQRAIIGLAPTYAMEIERRGHAGLGATTRPDDPTYLQIIDAQKRWLAANPVVNDIYTFRPVDAQHVALIADSETDYDRNGRFEGERETRTAIGEQFELGGPHVERAWAGQGGLDPEPATDRWGTWVTAFWPLRDAQGRVEAILGVDYDAASWLAEIRAERGAAIMIVAIVLVLLLAACALFVLQRIELATREAAAEAMRAARDAAESANRLKSQFLACMSHEIRTPMNGVMGVTELLLATPLDERQRRYGDLIHSSATNLLAVLNDILDYSKIEADRLVLEAVDFVPLRIVEDVVELLGPRAREKGLALGVEVHTGATAAVRGDPGRLRQVLTNLIGNAIKFTHEGAVAVRIEGVGRDPARLRLRCEIRDTGPGIDAATRALLFEPFMQADSSITRRFGGTGLGLAICKQLVTRMGGTIGCDSMPGQGANFWFEIPFEAASARIAPVAAEGPHAFATSSESSAATPRASRGRVLLAEDNAINQLIAREMLESLGYVVEVVADGRAALERLCASRSGFDAVLMDCEMPELDGPSATRRLRELERTRPEEHAHVPVIALTAHAADSDREACLAAGMDDYLSKPMTREQLAAVLERWCAPRTVAAADQSAARDAAGASSVAVSRSAAPSTR